MGICHEINKKLDNSPKKIQNTTNKLNGKKEMPKKQNINISDKGNICNIKSKYIILQIFENIERKKFLQIIKYNKELQKKIDIGVNDYKYYFENYSPIEIEIIPADKKYIFFMNPTSEMNDYNYHLYINDINREIKKKYLFKKKDKVKKIKIVMEHEIKSFSKLFQRCDIKSITFKKFNRKNINDMSYMFNECDSLEEFNFSNFNTDNVINMKYMFNKCSSLQRLNLSNFNTNNVTNMSYMFNECRSLKELDISNFNTAKVTDMSYMISHLPSLVKLKLPYFIINENTNIKNILSKIPQEIIKRINPENKHLIK